MTDTIVIQDKSSVIKTVAIVIVTAILCWVIFGHCGVGQPKPKIADVSDSVKTIIATKDKDLRKYQDSMKFKNEQIAYSNSVTEEAVTMSNQASDDASNMRDKLSATQKELAKYKAAKDTVGQLSSCDELSKQVTVERTKAQTADAACKTAIEGLRDLAKRKDEALAIQGHEINKMKSSLDLLGNTLQLVPDAIKEPWVKGYLGAEGDVGKDFGGGPSVLLVFRGGITASAAIKIMGGTQVYEAGLHKLISFKKK